MHDEYLEAFLAESMENVERLEAFCLTLEREGSKPDLLDEMFRAAHTLKGMSATMGFSKLAALTHRVEDLLGTLRDERVRLEPRHVDALLLAVDRMRARIQAIGVSAKEPDEPDDDAMDALAGALRGGADVGGTREEDSKPFANLSDWANRAAAEGKELYTVHIRLAPDCVMPGVRLAMAYQALKASAILMAAHPAEENVMAGQVEATEAFAAVMVAPGEIDRVRQGVLDVTDVSSCEVSKVSESHSAPKEDAPRAEQGDAPIEPRVSRHANGSSPAGADLRRDATLRVPVRKVDALMNTLSDLVITKTRLATLVSSADDPALKEAVERLDRLTGDIQDGLMRLRMVPVETIFHRYPRMMRDLEHRLQREFDFVMTGLDTEMDRVVLEEMGEVIVHLLRNAVDHGLEPPEARESQGKPRRGIVRLAAYTASGHVYLEVSDDGRGIDRGRVLETAVAKGWITPEEGAAMSDESVYALLFRPGFSTAERVSDISGRGVGLDAVREKVEALGGQIRLNSVLGAGTTFTIELPLTLAILSALLVSVRGQVFAIPTANVDEVRRVTRDDVRHVQERPVFQDSAGIVPIVDLAERLGLGSRRDAYPQTAVVCRDGKRRLALVVDHVLDELEIVNKPLGRYLQGVREFAGATILGDGRVSLILDVRSIANPA
ncbi:chemotaxis protein CheA [Alicyclobacillus acidocaldarius]|uniref:Chemotaxis protein CheA n=1 Tax=Alicyclobacillus acidocaldarius subsp. acidocaldarius (strain ATCC 27009 / DSM 446 / BCRC 14685 / JCM 5260 / KCTC 1825 / NBRC 15652 / NCIMB 11725 / NRRL B-14509 / 104-IA) TaxID=521098 RepID=C8WWG9_ALIAD|nr:chemotaxis protein CheA [Alicyclobacillus acidocaldarius]ACV58440.1 CheA signal transduction histidine kinase [Alicyclobacillus acidocaldarius subsp. acidocaldarius DSM 446]